MNLAWAAVGGDRDDLDHVSLSHDRAVLPSAFDVTGLAVDSASCALLGFAELMGATADGTIQPVAIDVDHVAASFGSERHLTTTGWDLPPTWDPIAGDYQSADGWIRLHTNYDNHRTAVCTVLDVPAERDAVAAIVAGSRGHDLERAIVDAGGAAAVLRSEAEWAASEQGQAVAAEPLVHTASSPSRSDRDLRVEGRSLEGLRVLDLTRVIAGPTATQFLASYGADVLRLDPTGFEEVPLVLPIVTAGKRCAWLDIGTPSGSQTFADLIAKADVLITSLRGDAIDRLGFDQARLWDLNPGLVVVRNSAYGWTGPDRYRRGFDSLVQMSTGIADTGQRWANADRPTPLPVQALDYGTGYLMAAAALRGVTNRLHTGRGTEYKVSLARTARWLADRERDQSADQATFDPLSFTEHASTEWGVIRRIAPLGGVARCIPAYGVDPGRLGRHQPTWVER